MISQVLTQNEFAEMCAKTKKKTPEDLKHWVWELILEDKGALTAPELAVLSANILTGPLNMCTRFVVPYLMGSKQMMEFFIVMWVSQGQNLIDRLDVHEKIMLQLRTLLVCKWDPAFIYHTNMLQFYPFGVHQPNTGYLGADVYHNQGVMTCCLQFLNRYMTESFTKPYSGRAYRFHHEDAMHDRIGEKIWDEMRLPMIFWFCVKLLKVCTSGDKQLGMIKLCKEALSIQPDHKIHELLDYIQKCVQTGENPKGTEILKKLLLEAKEKILKI